MEASLKADERRPALVRASLADLALGAAEVTLGLTLVVAGRIAGSDGGVALWLLGLVTVGTGLLWHAGDRALRIRASFAEAVQLTPPLRGGWHGSVGSAG